MNVKTQTITRLNILANVLLAGASFAAWAVSGSAVVLGEAMNSVGDAFAAVVVDAVVRLARQAPDKEHPFGHGRIEPLGGLVVAVGMALLAWELLKRSAVGLWQGGTHIEYGAAAVAVLLAHVAVKSVIAAAMLKVGRERQSPSVMAAAADARNDVLLAAASLVGLGGALAGYAWLDPAAALFLSLYIFYSGFNIGMENISYLIGAAPDEETIADIRRAALAVDGVRGVHDVMAHYVGPYVHVALHVSVGGGLSAEEAHDIADRVTDTLEGRKMIDRAFVHVDPPGAR